MLLVIPLLHKDLRAGKLSNAPELLIAHPCSVHSCPSLRSWSGSVTLRLINQEQVQKMLGAGGVDGSSTTTLGWRGHREGTGMEGDPHRLSSELTGEGEQVNCKLPVGVSARLTGHCDVTTGWRKHPQADGTVGFRLRRQVDAGPL